ncbi:inactive tyrosine-protein kinase PEAK1 [Xiphophorus couchianus]|uniref:inactive tyrosine-protein kinase PEAK1 n=1 Tax=Xiphophorus couchianus TaxID=32473 RepID=UPI001016DE26|nr:inactive tyrosine-protein kinase PEAK1-like [Xiphophorus couchianus]
MASASGSREKDQPPRLPVKQHRRSSVESDSVFSPAGFQHPSFAYSDVFSEPTDCHAAQCPIHQRYDPFKHQTRFFSDGTPPPVPKKKLTRALSLPGIEPPAYCSLSPLSPLQRHPQNFDNPLYMMAPIPDTFMHEETQDLKPARRSPIPLQPLSQLSFDTPDEHLASVFGSFEDQRVVSGRIQHSQLLFLRSMAQSVEERSILKVKEKECDSYEPQDFLLCEGSKPKKIGGKTYYSLQSPKFPGRVLGLRACKGTKNAPLTRNKENLHANVQDAIAYFQPSIDKESETNATQDLSTTGESDCRAPDPPDRGSNEKAPCCPSMTSLTVNSLLQRGHCVSVERDLPHTTLEDFVQDSCLVQPSDCQNYNRQVCVLVLQVLMGSHHLHSNSAAAAELRPREILLVWPGRQRWKGRDVLEQDGQIGWVQELWRKYGCPRVLVTPQSAALAPQALTSIKCQMGALIQFCLRPQEAHKDPTLSVYRTGLLHLSSLLQSESGPQMTDIIAMLQVLLWGPRVSRSNHRGSLSLTAVQNWLTVKRALLVMKLAEVGLIQDQSGVDWEDCMCLKYLPFTDSETVMGAAMQLSNILS